MGWVIGRLRWLTGGGDGMPRPDELGKELTQQAARARYMPLELDELMRRHPSHPQPLIEFTNVLQEAGKWEELAAATQALRRLFASQAHGYILGCTALRRLGRHEEAEPLAISAMLRFPRARSAFESYAYCASDRGDWPEAERRWTTAARRFSNWSWARLMWANALFQIGRRDEADAMLAAAVQTWPEEWVVWLSYGDMATRLGHWPEAVRRWREARARFIERPEPFARLTEALVGAGEIAEAEALIAEGSFLFPRHPGILAARTKVSEAGGDPGPLPG